MAYINHIGGSFFPGFDKSQSSKLDRILARVRHLNNSSLVTSVIQFSLRKPPYARFQRVEGVSRLARFIRDLKMCDGKRRRRVTGS